MNRFLLIEIKDNCALVTLSDFKNGRWSILLSKKYDFNFKNKLQINSNIINYDINWMKKMKDDIEEVVFFNTIDKKVLVINNFYTLSKTIKVTENPTISNKEIVKNIKNNISERYSNLKLVEFNINEIEVTPIKKDIEFSYELINNDILEVLISYLKAMGIKIDEVFSSNSITKRVVKDYQNINSNIFNIKIEEEYISIDYLENGKIKKSFKNNNGLIYIYKFISKQLNIDLKTSKKLFLDFGSIPPESIIDNRIIYDGKNLDNEKIYFSKKDLSEAITKSVDQLFTLIKEVIKRIKDTNKDYSIVFSGEIINLKGFDNYSKDKFEIKSVLIFKNDIVGFEFQNEMVSSGMMFILEDRISNDLNIDIEFQSNKLINKKNKKILKIFIDRVNKYYNYI